MLVISRQKAPRNFFRTVGSQRVPNSKLGAREYLTAAEVGKLNSEARNGRHGHRDATLILVAYRHGLRASEIADLEWSQVELGRNATLHVRRAKNGKPSAHPAARRRGASAARASSAIPGFDLRLRHRAWRPVYARCHQPADQAHRRAGEIRLSDSHSHAASRLRIRPGQCRPRHPAHSGLAWPSVNPAHDALHAIERGVVQGLLAVK